VVRQNSENCQREHDSDLDGPVSELFLELNTEGLTQTLTKFEPASFFMTKRNPVLVATVQFVPMTLTH
jgi:hypothetical protein